MIQHGVDVNTPATRGRTAHCITTHVNEAEAIEVLIEAGRSVEAEDTNGARPLHTCRSYAQPRGGPGPLEADSDVPPDGLAFGSSECRERRVSGDGGCVVEVRWRRNSNKR